MEKKVVEKKILCAGPRVLCLLQVESFIWLGTEVGEIFYSVHLLMTIMMTFIIIIMKITMKMTMIMIMLLKFLPCLFFFSIFF